MVTPRNAQSQRYRDLHGKTEAQRGSVFTQSHTACHCPSDTRRQGSEPLSMPPSNSCLRELDSGGRSCPRDPHSRIIRTSRGSVLCHSGECIRAWSHWALSKQATWGMGSPGAAREGDQGTVLPLQLLRALVAQHIHRPHPWATGYMSPRPMAPWWLLEPRKHRDGGQSRSRSQAEVPGLGRLAGQVGVQGVPKLRLCCPRRTEVERETQE